MTARAVTEGVSYEAIVLPTTGAAQQGRVFTVEAPLLGRTYTWTMPDDYLFVGGKIHEIEITVDVDGISVVTGDIADWNGGDSNPKSRPTMPNSSRFPTPISPVRVRR